MYSDEWNIETANDCERIQTCTQLANQLDELKTRRSEHDILLAKPNLPLMNRQILETSLARTNTYIQKTLQQIFIYQAKLTDMCQMLELTQRVIGFEINNINSNPTNAIATLQLNDQTEHLRTCLTILRKANPSSSA